jgi:hypothetical protein
VSDGVFVIPDNRVPLVPNVGFVVGDRAVLVIDTGLGPRNGAHVLDQARRLAPSVTASARRPSSRPQTPGPMASSACATEA